eukprot:887019-Amphidinium_carterae.2
MVQKANQATSTRQLCKYYFIKTDNFQQSFYNSKTDCTTNSNLKYDPQLSTLALEKLQKQTIYGIRTTGAIPNTSTNFEVTLCTDATKTVDIVSTTKPSTTRMTTETTSATSSAKTRTRTAYSIDARKCLCNLTVANVGLVVGKDTPCCCVMDFDNFDNDEYRQS